MDDNTRVRMSLEQNSKGTFQINVSVESPSVETSKQKLAEALDAVEAVCAEKHLIIVGRPAW